jgi:hypothetical protein
MRLTIDRENVELGGILENLLREDANISAREIARRHSKLKNASAFTRHPERKALIATYIQRQADARAVRSPHAAGNGCDAVIHTKTARVNELEQQVKVLVAGYVGVIRAVQAAGGMRALERFWSEYKQVADSLSQMGATPPSATVTEISAELVAD